MKLTEIAFPVYKLGSIEPIRDSGELYFRKLRRLEDDSLVETKLVVDNRNLPGFTLAIRRLALLEDKEVQLYKLKSAIFFLADLLKLATPKTWFIDANGKTFRYIKTHTVKLIFKPIKRIIPVLSGGAILEIEGLPSRYKCLAKPSEYKKYAGMLHTSSGAYILYGTYDELPKDTRRKI